MSVSSLDFSGPFPDGMEGLVAVGGRIDVPTLRAAYSAGVFPWPQPNYPWLWFCPDERGVLFFDEMKLNRSWQRALKFAQIQNWTIKQNTAFEEVMRNCLEQKRKGQSGTWILPEMIAPYVELARRGEALSFEVWSSNVLIGGLYGVYIKGIFSGESMFHLQTHASKIAFVHAARELQSWGLAWMDLQMVTPLMQQIGGRYLSRKKYLQLLKKSQRG